MSEPKTADPDSHEIEDQTDGAFAARLRLLNYTCPECGLNVRGTPHGDMVVTLPEEIESMVSGKVTGEKK